MITFDRLLFNYEYEYKSKNKYMEHTMYIFSNNIQDFIKELKEQNEYENWLKDTTPVKEKKQTIYNRRLFIKKVQSKYCIFYFSMI